MMYAKNELGERIEPTKNVKAWCPSCNALVRAKCGKIKVWHFSHVSLVDCDTWSEGETEWHRNWKERFPKEEREVIMFPHRADVVHSGVVIEFQSKALQVDELLEREDFYGNMIWVVKSDEKKFTYNKREKNGRKYYAFYWRWCSTTWKMSNRQIYVDLENGTLFKIWKIYDNNCGAGEIVSYDKFILRQ